MGIDLNLNSTPGGHSRNCSLLQFTLAFTHQFNNQHLRIVPMAYNTSEFGHGQ